jgi:hypothetical protein
MYFRVFGIIYALVALALGFVVQDTST